MTELNSAIVPPKISSIMGVIDTHLRWKNLNGPPRGFEKYHPSAFGKCLREMQYLRYFERGYMPDVKVEKEEFNSKQLRNFGNGHGDQSRWEEYVTEIGILRGYWECTNPFCKAWDEEGKLDATVIQKFKEEDPPRSRMYGKDNIIGCFKPERCKCGCAVFAYHEVDIIEKDLNFYGHCDMIWDFSRFDPSKYDGVKKAFNMEFIPTKPFVIDMKTINEKGFERLLKMGPSIEYRIQLTIYANVLNVDFGLLVYENKNTHDVASYEISKNTNTIYAKVKEQAETMNKMVALRQLPPPRPDSKDDYACSKCGFKKICHASKVWADPNLEEKRKKFYGNLM